MKKIIAGTIIFAALSALTAFGADEGITLNIDGEELECDVAPQIIDGRTMVPVRAIFEAVGAEVSYESETKTVTAVKDDTTVVMVIDSAIEEINGEQTEMDTAPVIIEGRTFAPARYVAEAFGCEVGWDGITKTVDITTPAETEAEINEEETETEAEETEEASSGYDLSFFLEKDFDISPIDYSSMTEDEAIIHETVRYNFEQLYLYSALEENKETLAGYLAEFNKADFCESVFEYWEGNINNCIAAGLMLTILENGEDEYTLDLEGITEDFEGITEYFTDECMLYSGDNFGVMLREVEPDTTMLLIQMAEDEYITSCNYIAVLFDKDCNFRYFTLEKSLDDYYAFCEVSANGHSTLKALDSTQATKENFLNMACDEYFSLGTV